MKPITKPQLKRLFEYTLESDMKLAQKDVYLFILNGISFWYDRYEITDLDEDDFVITFYEKNRLSATYRTYEFDYVCIDCHNYQII